ncbi:MAG: hypothetical protein ACLU4J_28370, partial [Butyricimonas paravirosa]
MRTLKYILASLLVPFCLTSCDTAQDWIDTGVSSPYHDCSIMEYLRGDQYNWELTVQMIERGGLTAMFEGTDPDYEKITFFAIPSYTILRYLWDNDLKADIAYRNPDYLITDQKQDGGTALTTVGGRKLKAYVDKSSYG